MNKIILLQDCEHNAYDHGLELYLLADEYELDYSLYSSKSFTQYLEKQDNNALVFKKLAQLDLFNLKLHLVSSDKKLSSLSYVHICSEQEFNEQLQQALVISF